MKIYLDHNVYLEILLNRQNGNNIINKVNELKRSNNTFWYSPAHLEEIANIRDKDEQVNDNLKLITQITDNNELFPGYTPKEEIINMLFLYNMGFNLPKSYLNKLLIMLAKWESGEYVQNDIYIKFIIEDPRDCFERVICDMETTEWAVENDTRVVGMRNKNTISKLNLPNDQEDFEVIRKNLSIESTYINSLEPNQVFEQSFMNELCKQRYNFTLNTIKEIYSPKGFDNISSALSFCLNLLEVAGYHVDKKCDSIKIKSRMNDVTHGIYATSTDMLVTNDKMFTYRLKASYSFLGIRTSIISVSEFLNLNC